MSDHDPAPHRTAPPPDPRPWRSGRVVIISASVGAGHDGAAAQLTARLAAQGVRVDRHDFLDLLPTRLGPAISGSYHRLLTYAPWAYQRIYAATEGAGRPGPAVRTLVRAAEHGVLDVLPPDTAAVISTYPVASQVLGALRRGGLLAAPALTYLTDFSVHPLWVAPGIDAHLAAHPVPAEQARALGAAGVTVSGPVVDPRFTPATTRQRAAARDRFGLPAGAPLALLVAGSWGVGPIRRTAAEIRATGVAVPVVVCGRNRSLADRLRADGIEHAYGWVTDMPGLMHAADVLVQNAGGLTSLEAMASGLPVASYGCIPGHGRTNAAALDEAGLAVWIRAATELRPVLAELLDGPRGVRQRAASLDLFEQSAGPAETVMHTAQAGAACAPPAAPPPSGGMPAPDAAAVSRPRRRVRRAGLAAAVGSALWLGTGGTEIAVAYGALGAVNAHATTGAYLVVHPPAGTVLDDATVQTLRTAHAAVAIDRSEAVRNPGQVRRLATAGLTLVNAGDGPPYTTGFLARRGGITSGAGVLRRLTGTAPAFYLSDSDLDALDVGLVHRSGARLLIPDQLLPCDAAGAAPGAGRVVLLECGSATAKTLAAGVHRLLAESATAAIRLTAVNQLIEGRHR